jgi:hypothetical protein
MPLSICAVAIHRKEYEFIRTAVRGNPRSAVRPLHTGLLPCRQNRFRQAGPQP